MSSKRLILKQYKKLCRTLHISNVPRQTTREFIDAVCRGYGAIDEVRDAETPDRTRRTFFCQFKAIDAAKAAIADINAATFPRLIYVVKEGGEFVEEIEYKMRAEWADVERLKSQLDAKDLEWL